MAERATIDAHGGEGAMSDESTTRIYQGHIVSASNGEEGDLLGLSAGDAWDKEILAERLQEDLDEFGRYASVRYFVSDVPLTAEQLEDALIRTLEGELEVDYGMRYTEITGYLWTDESLLVGGHDLLEELKSYVGKWLHLEVLFRRQPLITPKRDNP